jgi:hypothetical protein
MRPQALCLVAVAMTWSVFLYAEERSTLDQVLYRPDGTVIWIPVHESVAEDGSLRSDLLGQHFESVRRNMERNRAATTAGVRDCHFFMGSIPGHYSSTSSLRDLSTHAHVIVSGTVRAMREGFYGGLPGTLMSLDARALKGKAPTETLVFYPLARIATSTGLVCAKPVGEFEPPRVGDRLLIFAMVQPLVINGRVFLNVNTAREMLHDRRGVRAVIPKALRAEVSGFDVAERRVINEIERQRQAQ